MQNNYNQVTNTLYQLTNNRIPTPIHQLQLKWLPWTLVVSGQWSLVTIFP